MLLEAYARGLLNKKSDILGTADVVDAYMVVVRALKGLREREWIRSWKVPAGIFLSQMFPLRITPFLCIM